ncbi:MAG: hypothetical protein ABIA66_04220 [Candidatus Omnitrophota bacterium]
MLSDKVYLNLGGLKVSIDIKDAYKKRTLRLPYKCFVTSKPKKTDFNITVNTKIMPDFKPGETIFDTEYSWMLHAFNGGYLYQDRLIREDYGPYIRRAIVKKDFSHATIYCSEKSAREFGLFNWIFDVPIGQFLMTSVFAKKQALVIHSCAVKHKGEGLVFMGFSGSGKSTLAGLWRKSKMGVVLSDERIVVRKINRGYRIFGTPWTGSNFAFANTNAPLKRIYLISHAKENSIRPVSPNKALPIFLANMRLPLWDKEKTNQVINMVNEVLFSVPIFELGFKPTEEILKLIAKEYVR